MAAQGADLRLISHRANVCGAKADVGRLYGLGIRIAQSCQRDGDLVGLGAPDPDWHNHLHNGVRISRRYFAEVNRHHQIV